MPQCHVCSQWPLPDLVRKTWVIHSLSVHCSCLFEAKQASSIKQKNFVKGSIWISFLTLTFQPSYGLVGWEIPSSTTVSVRGAQFERTHLLQLSRKEGHGGPLVGVLERSGVWVDLRAGAEERGASREPGRREAPLRKDARVRQEEQHQAEAAKHSRN